MATPNATGFADLLHQAVHEPGTISRAYQQFHRYSLGNQLLAMFQCHARGLQPGPINTYPGWKALGRYVSKGQKAITLCMPITIKRRETTDDQEAVFTRFVYKSRWFVYAQTEGEALAQPEIPSWDKDRALAALEITEIPFDYTDGNCMGCARDRSVAVNPVNPLPHKTRFHELAHVLLGHTAEGTQADSEVTPRNLRECEAEAVALVCCAALDLPGIQECRGYVQHWWGQGNAIPERSAQRVLKVADQILKAGTSEVSS